MLLPGSLWVHDGQLSDIVQDHFCRDGASPLPQSSQFAFCGCDKQLGEDLVQLILYSLSSREPKTETPGKDLDAGSETDMVQWCFLACLTWLAQLPLLYNLGPSAQGCHHTIHGGLDPPTPSAIKEMFHRPV